MLPAVYNWPVPNPEAICLPQSSASAGSLQLNGYLTYPFPGFSRKVSLTSPNNLAAVQFTITGIYQTRPRSQTIAGPNANTVETTVDFDLVTSIVANAAYTDVSAGIGTTGHTHYYVYNTGVPFSSCSVQVEVTSGAISYGCWGTLLDVTTIENPTIFQVCPQMPPGTNSSQLGTLFVPPGSPIPSLRFVDIVIDASNSTGSLVAIFQQQG